MTPRSVFARVNGSEGVGALRMEVGGGSAALAAALTGKDWLLLRLRSAKRFREGLTDSEAEEEASVALAVEGLKSKTV